MSKAIPVLIVLLAGAGVGLVAWMPGRKVESPPTETPPVNVKLLRVRAEPRVPDTILLPGVVEPNRIVKVPAEVGGRIEEICYEEGAPYRADTPMIRLNADLLKAEYQRAEAMARYDRDQRRRVEAALKGGAATAAELEELAAKADASQAALDVAKTRLDRATIRCPVSGILNKLLVEVGEYVSSGDPVGEIVDLDRAKVAVDVPERDVQYLSIGARQEVFADVRGREREVAGTITYISELADEHTRTSRAEITVDNRRLPAWWRSIVGKKAGGATAALKALAEALTVPVAALLPSQRPERALRSGQIVRVRLIRRVLRDVIEIPLGAVIPLEEGKAVYVVADGKAQRRQVELGFFKGRSVQILSGLADGDWLIVSGHRFVSPGQPVAVKERTSQ